VWVMKLRKQARIFGIKLFFFFPRGVVEAQKADAKFV